MTKEEMLELRTMMKEVVTEEIEPLQNAISALNKSQEAMSDRFTQLELKIENETDRAIQALSEGHTILNRKLDENIGLEARVETLEHKVSAIEYTLKEAK